MQHMSEEIEVIHAIYFNIYGMADFNEIANHF